ncbi:MAG: MerR family transcriptional regulator [Acidobacteria bacterium]|nr:MerR family transcriptional regulator [Acidobacteriota bacterium]
MSERCWYQASEFAKLTGVTVRTLHHYDRLGLLQPSGRTAAGYRLYGERDFARLQQIVTLKFIGFSLAQIKAILNQSTDDLANALRVQREIIEDKLAQLQQAVKAIAEVEQVVASQAEIDWQAFNKIIEVINMQNEMEWAKKYYDQEAQQAIAKRLKQWTPELQAKAEQDWATLIKDVETAIANGADPASANAQALAARWTDLIGQFTQGNPAIREGLNKLYADQQHWPTTFKKPYSDEVGEFICKAVAIWQERAQD